MKTIYSIFRTAAFLLFVAVLPTSCVREESEKVPIPGGPIELMAQIGSHKQSRADAGTVITTRVNGDNFENGDQVGIYMLTENGSLPGDIVDNNNNRRYRITDNDAGTGVKLAPSLPEHNMFYPGDGSVVSFVAYYPYKPTIENYTYLIDVSEQGEQNLDLLYSTGAKGSSSTAAGMLTFRHKLSKLVINLKQAVGMSDNLSSIYATLGGMPSQASLALADGTLTPDASSDDTPIIIGKNTMVNAVAVFDAIVIPHDGADHNNRTITFSTGSVDYRWTMPDNINFEENKKYTCSFTLRGIDLAFNGVTVTDWEDSESGLVFPVARIPAGTFWMGASDGKTEITFNSRTFTPTEDKLRQPDGRELPMHQVRISKDFYLSKYEVTNAQYCAFLNSLAAANDPDYSVEIAGTVATAYYMVDGVKRRYAQNCTAGSYWGMVYDENTKRWAPNVRADLGNIDYANYPAVYISWFGARAFCEWVNGRLPTEAEWEYAAYGGRYFVGDNPILVPGGNKEASLNYAWWGYNNAPSGGIETIDGYPNGPKPIGTRLPNVYGLYDMIGNAWEYCHDWYSKDYYLTLAGSIAVDPTGPDDPVDNLLIHPIRGGGSGSTDFWTRFTGRNYYTEEQVGGTSGFRIVFDIN